METAGKLIDERFILREQKRAHEEAIKQLEQKLQSNESALLELLDKEGITKAAGKRATVSISENIKPSVEDWDRFYAYIQRNKAWHLLERRPSVSGCNELFELKGAIPGVVPFKKRQVNMRNA